LTVAVAVLAEPVAGPGDYRAVVGAVHDEVAGLAGQMIGRPVAVAVNHADGQHPYLTLSGSSAEAGHDGQVGRGNRFGGLITPFRPMSMEACAGKNPVSHVGKTYTIATACLHDWRGVRDRLLAGAYELF
jgi:S-adenosylmethionine synthetase